MAVPTASSSVGLTAPPSSTEEALSNSGIILPPPDLRDLVEKTAPFVARNGPTFEERLREKGIPTKALYLLIEKFNPKFCFLNPFDAYHKYYSMRVQECRMGVASTVVPRAAATAVTTRSRDTERKEKPRDFKFSVDMPPISAQDLDIIRLTAQYVAKNGRSFITSLSQRESRNYQFDFLRSNHTLYPFFNQMVQQYSQILAPPASLIPFLSEDREQILTRCRKRADYLKSQAQQKLQQKEDEEKDRIAFAQIDWHAFSVVQTIEFTPHDQTAKLAQPVDLYVLKSASLEQKALMQTLDAPSLALAPVKQITQTGEPESIPSQPTLAPRKNYLTKSQGMQKCPRCNQMFRSDEIEEHMRVELLDPKWKTQKERADSKYSSTNLYTESAAQTLKRLNDGTTSDPKRQRADIGPRR